MAAPDLSRGANRQSRRRGRTAGAAVGLSMALHALAGLALAWCLGRTPAETRPQPQRAGATVIEDEAPFECETYLLPTPQAKSPRIVTNLLPASPPETPPPQPVLPGLPAHL